MGFAPVGGVPCAAAGVASAAADAAAAINPAPWMKCRRSVSMVIGLFSSWCRPRETPNCPAVSWQRRDGDPVEPCHAVGLGPQRHLAWAGESRVVRAVERLAVVTDREEVALRAQAERVPFVRRDLDVDAGELLAAALHDAIEAHVVLERIGARDVVVVGIGQPYGDAAGAVDLAGDRLEAEHDLDVAR